MFALQRMESTRTADRRAGASDRDYEQRRINHANLHDRATPRCSAEARRCDGGRAPIEYWFERPVERSDCIPIVSRD